jgi:hypothetical protein
MFGLQNINKKLAHSLTLLAVFRGCLNPDWKMYKYM